MRFPSKIGVFFERLLPLPFVLVSHPGCWLLASRADEDLINERARETRRGGGRKTRGGKKRETNKIRLGSDWESRRFFSQRTRERKHVCLSFLFFSVPIRGQGKGNEGYERFDEMQRSSETTPPPLPRLNTQLHRYDALND